jgi:hypothetical protein
MTFRHIPIKIVFFFHPKIFSVEKRNRRSGDPFLKHLLKRKNEKKESPVFGGYGQKAREWGGLRCGWLWAGK